VQIQESAQTGEFVEGCLSLPGIGVKVTRPERIRVTGFDVRGQRRSFAATGLWARVIQHELDHLNGVLICDYGHPAESCEQCQLALPAVLVEERKHQSHPSH
jgi:peptide deformylase